MAEVLFEPQQCAGIILQLSRQQSGGLVLVVILLLSLEMAAIHITSGTLVHFTPVVEKRAAVVLVRAGGSEMAFALAGRLLRVVCRSRLQVISSRVLLFPLLSALSTKPMLGRVGVVFLFTVVLK